MTTAPQPPALDPEPEGLRERKKRQTREAIAAAALDLFARQGYAATTIAQIAAAADVSPRTVFGYFASKEELIFLDQAEWFGRLETRITGRPDHETAPEALRAWMEEMLGEWAGRETEMRVRGSVIAADEGLCALKARNKERVWELLADAIAKDLGRPPDALEPRMAAAATTAILETLDRYGQEACPPADLQAWRAEALAAVDRAVVFIAAGIRALRDADRGG
ncbi:MAG TPA: TetR/AcrR family transcriptional regulator [Miltoncostaeaceae bacterium]|nr:TetR/AcrR family transcriptional regulator [Miltoncostaeaceae bacterium]